jgi:hypothetical protein
MGRGQGVIVAALTAALLALPSAALAKPDSGRYLVGAATRSINPGADGKFAGETVYLGGYGLGASRAATGVLGEGASVRAFTVSDGTRTVALADIEAQGWFAATRDGPYGLVDVRRAVAQRTGGAIPAERVIVQSDHSHAGIDAMGVWGGMPAAYRKYVLDRTVEAIVAAYRSARRGRLYYGTADGTDLLSNQFGYDAANKDVDGEVRVLQARDARGRAFVTMLNFSAHATVLGSGNTKVSGDWVQRANPLLERRFRGSAVTIVGTLGRTQPADRGCADKALTGDAQSLCSLDDYATRVVDRAAQAARDARPLPAKAIVDGRSYLVQDVGTNPLLLGLLYAGAAAQAPLNRSLTPPWQTGPVIGTTTASVRIGDLLLSAMPGEAYPQLAAKVRELVPGRRGYLTAGLANDQLGYLIAPYEAYPEPVRRTFFNERGDEVSPVDNDNYAFNVSQTMGERVSCSLLRGAGELDGRGDAYRAAYDRCAPFFNDAAGPPGADVG